MMNPDTALSQVTQIIISRKVGKNLSWTEVEFNCAKTGERFLVSAFPGREEPRKIIPVIDD